MNQARDVTHPDRRSSVSFEPHRPAYHYTPARNWVNDPNGLVWYDGEYHLFYQYNPHGTGWGNMSWGHAVSPDLVAWAELPVAIPHTDDEEAFSGSIVVDHLDTSGFAADGVPAMVAIYTAASPATGRQAQALAYSTDRGRTWTRYGGNPVLDLDSSDFRDPKVFWYAPGRHWVMAVVLATEHRVRFYRSDDLRSWTHLSDFGPAGAVGGVWECPDLFELPVDGDPANTRWVLVVSLSPGGIAGGSGTQYFIGHFDGTGFVPDAARGEDEPASWLDFGADYYAAVSFADTPGNERILVGWMSNWSYAAQTPPRHFRGSMSLPRVHRLATLDGRIRLLQEPVAGLAGLRSTSFTLRDRALGHGITPMPDDAHGELLEIRAVFEPGSAQRFGLLVRVGADERTVVGYDMVAGALYVDRTDSGDVGFHAGFGAVHRAPLPPRDGVVTVTVLVDRASVEVFGGAGERVITDQIFPSPTSTGVALFADGGTATLVDLTITALDSDTNNLEMTGHPLPAKG
jgi:fructan beta-fructosidase